MLSSRPWRIEAVIQLIAGLFACLGLGVVVAGLAHQAGVAAFKSPDSFANILVGTLSFHGAACVLIFIFLKQHGLNWRDALGLDTGNLPKKLALAAGALALALPVVFGLEYISVQALDKMGWPPENQRAVELILRTQSAGIKIYLALFAIILAPLAEEFVFRGVLFPFLKQCGWPKLAWLGVSFLFALMHVNAPTLLPLFALALVLTWLYEKTNCLLAPIAAHSLFNTANLVLLLLQS